MCVCVHICVCTHIYMFHVYVYIKTLAPWKKSSEKTRQHIKKQRHYFTYKGLYSQSYGFSSTHVWMWELDSKKGEALNWCLQTVVLKKILESPLDSKEIKPLKPKGNQSWIFTGRTDAEAEAPLLWPPDAKSWLTRKDPDAGKDWRQEKKGTQQRMRWLDAIRWTWVWASSGSCWWSGKPARFSCCSVAKSC